MRRNTLKLTHVIIGIVLCATGLSDVTVDRWPVSKNGKWGYISKGGKLAIPYKFTMARHFSGGLASVKMNGKWGAIRSDGTFVIAPVYAEISPNIKGKILATSYSNWWEHPSVLLDATGKVLQRSISIDQGDPGDGLSILTDPWIGLYSDFVGSAASFLWKPGWQPLRVSRTLRLQDKNQDGIAQWVNGQRGVGPRLRLHGGLVLGSDATEDMYPIWSLSGQSGYELKLGFMSVVGKVIVKPQFSWMEPFYGGLARVGYGVSGDNPKGRWGYIDRAGKWIWRSWVS